jgi:hypothetical protein
LINNNKYNNHGQEEKELARGQKRLDRKIARAPVRKVKVTA